MSAVVFPAASAALTSGHVIISSSTGALVAGCAIVDAGTSRMRAATTEKIFMRRSLQCARAMQKTGSVLIAAGMWIAALPAPQPPQSPPQQTLPLPPTTQGRVGQSQPQPIIPVAVTALTKTPETYMGRTVSLTAAVEQRYGATAFSIDQNARATDVDILVLPPVLTAPIEPNSYVTVIGEVVRFEQSIIAAKMKDAMPALAPDVVEKYRGRPAIIAVSVITSGMTDVAKRLPPPMTPEEEALSKVM